MELRKALRSIKSSFVFCRNLRAQINLPLMAELPTERLHYHSYPFTHVGIDYFAPFEVKLLRRSMKRWCCLSTGLTTRAVHIEVVRILDTHSCLVALKRFITRRGKLTTIMSDDGINFVGSAREFKEYINSWNQDQITSDLAQKHIVWKFKPPGAPHFGGVWERLVRSCKKAMTAVLGTRSMTDESSNLEALTPNHFILGGANVCVPFLPNAEIYSNHRKMFRSCQAYADMICKRWVSEYLPQNNVKTQWNKSEANVQVRDLVWLVDNNVKRSHYKMARIKEIYLGKRWCSEISAHQNS